MRRPKRTLRLRLWDIIHAIEVGRKAVGGLPRSEFQADEVRVFAAERSIAVISEASRHIPPEVTKKFDIPWAQISSIGNIIRHGYDIVDAEITWKIINEELAPLESAVRLIMAELEAE